MELFAPDPPLTDGVVVLRPPTEQDLPAIERGIWDPEVVRWFGRPEIDGAAVLEVNRTRWREGTRATFSICDPTGACLGHVRVSLGREGRGVVGYWLLPEARGMGLATRSVRLVSMWALVHVGLARLELYAEPENLASLSVAERSGFRREALLRSHGVVDGRRVDHVLFSLLPSDLGNMERP
jgi:RimJ/RimL family protein N-acetyltransferase